MRSNSDFDGVILGAGHNALILQAYLGKAGLKTVCLERRDVAGGGLSTVTDAHGFKHNQHSFYHRAITSMPWYRDLELERHGARYIEPPLNVALILRDGRALEWWTDFERTYESFAALSKKDAESLRRWRDEFVPMTELLAREAQSVPVDDREGELSKTREGRRLLEVSKLSPLEFVNAEFEHPVIRAGLLFFNGLREVDLRAHGFGHHIPALLASRHKAQMCVGGSFQLAKALLAAVMESGGEVRLSTSPSRICVEDGRVTGVETSTGEFIKARFVVSGLNPLQTFIDLIDADCLPAEWRMKASGYQFNLLAPLFALNVNLKEPPQYRVAGESFMTILGLEHADQFHEIVDCHERGEVPTTVMWGSCPTRYDPSQAPAGRHTAFMWEKLPYRLKSGDWDGAKDAHARRMIEVWSEYAPNLRDSILDYSARSPLDTERSLPNMREGDLLIGALSHGQTGVNRPFAGAGKYRGYFPNLYLCGGSSHPGGNITGLPGHNCAQVLLSDLGLANLLTVA